MEQDIYNEALEHIKSASLEELDKEFNEKVDFNELNKSINDFLKKYDVYNNIKEKIKKSENKNTIAIKNQLKVLDIQIVRVYEAFFKVQNIFNKFLNQKIIMTYVYLDKETGQREIITYNNDIEHIFHYKKHWITQSGEAAVMLRYDGNNRNHSKIFQNEYNSNLLEQTVQEIDRRRNKKFKIDNKEISDIVYWRYESNKFNNFYHAGAGPINEAYVNFYVNKQELKKSTGKSENNIHDFMLNDKYGAIKADNTNGFLVGDVFDKIGNQYAVKGTGGSPQSINAVAKSLKKIQNNLNAKNIKEVILKFTEEEIKKNENTQHVKKIVDKGIQDSLSSILDKRYRFK